MSASRRRVALRRARLGQHRQERRRRRASGEQRREEPGRRLGSERRLGRGPSESRDACGAVRARCQAACTRWRASQPDEKYSGRNGSWYTTSVASHRNVSAGGERRRDAAAAPPDASAESGKADE